MFPAVSLLAGIISVVSVRSAPSANVEVEHKAAVINSGTLNEKSLGKEETGRRKPARGVFTKMKEEIERLQWFFTLEDDVPPAIRAAKNMKIDVPDRVVEEDRALYVSSCQTWIAILKNSKSDKLMSLLLAQFAECGIKDVKKIAQEITLLYLFLRKWTHQETKDIRFKKENENDLIDIFKMYWKTTEEEEFLRTIRIIFRVYRTPLSIYIERPTKPAGYSKSWRYG